MVVDSSAVIASLGDEPDADRYRHALRTAPERLISALNAFECRVVVAMRHGDAMLREVELLFAKLPIQTVAFDGDQVVLALDADRRFGKATGHPAGLNLGDCAAYALARSRAAPLLFKGADFIHTDVTAALLTS